MTGVSHRSDSGSKQMHQQQEWSQQQQVVPSRLQLAGGRGRAGQQQLPNRRSSCKGFKFRP
jgi:hypothetical protein